MLFDIKKRREIIIEERDVTTVLSVINRHLRYYHHIVGNCGWAEYPTKWFVMFHTTDKTYGNIINEMKKIGKFDVDVRPGGQMDICFKRA